jgi:hypothetical protein
MGGARRWSLTSGIAAAALLIASPASAVDLAVPSADQTVQVHGFVSPGFVVTTGNNYLAKSKVGSFEFTEVGLNFTTYLSEKLRTGLQLFARDLGRSGNYTPRVDWFYMDYRFEDYFGVRAGRVKVPFGLYNDSSDIDAARVPVLLPQSIYPTQNRDFLLAQTGGEVYGRVNMRSLGALDYRLYGGTIFLDPASQSTVTASVTELEVPYVVGERLLWETPIEGLRGGAAVQALKLDASFNLPAGSPILPAGGPISIRIPAVLWVGSLEYSVHDLLLAAEYSRWIVRYDSSRPSVIPAARVISERAYAMASYRVAPWFHPGVYYSLLFPDVENRSGRDKVQHDLAATLRFDLNQHWLLKLEGHFMSGTAALDVNLNDGKPRTQLEKNWGAFFVKTTAYF